MIITSYVYSNNLFTHEAIKHWRRTVWGIRKLDRVPLNSSTDYSRNKLYWFFCILAIYLRIVVDYLETQYENMWKIIEDIILSIVSIYRYRVPLEE
jgi:hypothetical protein